MDLNCKSLPDGFWNWLFKVSGKQQLEALKKQAASVPGSPFEERIKSKPDIY